LKNISKIQKIIGGIFFNKLLVFTVLIGVYHFFFLKGVLFGFSGTFSCWMLDGTDDFSIILIMPLKKTRQGLGPLMDT